MPFLQQKLFARYDASRSAPSLSDLSLNLLEQQKTSWPQLVDGYAALDSVRVRDLQCDGFSVRLQFNPQRVVSSGAKVDEKSIRERRCFLCVENLPEPQKAILYREEFLVLCNPAPIFAQHYTISNLKHFPQSIEGHVASFFSLAKDFSPRCTVFYNGPKCGASAPDHMHFQSSPIGTIPMEQDVQDGARRILIKRIDGVSLFQTKNLGRGVILLEGEDREAIEALLLKYIAAMKSVESTPDEPMMNILCSYLKDLWRVVIFPRRKHRPEVFFREGDEKILISPAAVDMGGLIVTPIEKDFLTIDARLIESIYHEVSIDKDTANLIISML